MEILGHAASLLKAAGDREAAAAMAAYMKTTMPFYGVTSPERRQVLKHLVADHPVSSNDDYRRDVASLWAGRHREEKYLAIAWARRHRRFIGSDNLDLYQRMITEGAWWDFVDDIAANLTGEAFRRDTGVVRPVFEKWLGADDLWLRRTVILSQLKSKASTDTELLFDACERNLADSEFFIRKAIGWALREHSKTDPAAVRRFVDEHRSEMSGLSIREASKYL